MELGESLSRYLEETRICRIATMGPDGPHVAPFCPAFSGAGTLYVKTRPATRTALNLRHDPQAVVVVDDYAEDWDKLKLLSVTGTGRTLTRQSGREFEDAVRLLKSKFAQFQHIGIDIDFVIAIDVTGVRRVEGVDRG